MRRRWKHSLVGSVVALLALVGLLVAQNTQKPVSEVYDFKNGFKVAGVTYATGTSSAQVLGGGATLALNGTTSVTITGGTTGIQVTDANGTRRGVPATQTIAAGGTILADACGSTKNITAAGAVTTDTTNSLAAPALANNGCVMMVCNVGATNTITIDKNANILLVGGADVALLANSCIAVLEQWHELAANDGAAHGDLNEVSVTERKKDKPGDEESVMTANAPEPDGLLLLEDRVALLEEALTGLTHTLADQQGSLSRLQQQAYDLAALVVHYEDRLSQAEALVVDIDMTDSVELRATPQVAAALEDFCQAMRSNPVFAREMGLHARRLDKRQDGPLMGLVTALVGAYGEST